MLRRGGVEKDVGVHGTVAFATASHNAGSSAPRP
jgi:hypothetical protein